VYNPSANDTLFDAYVSVSTVFNGTLPTYNLNIGTNATPFFTGSLSVANLTTSGIGVTSNTRLSGTGKGYIFLNTDPLVLSITGGSTAGSATLYLWIGRTA